MVSRSAVTLPLSVPLMVTAPVGATTEPLNMPPPLTVTPPAGAFTAIVDVVVETPFVRPPVSVPADRSPALAVRLRSLNIELARKVLSP